MSHIVAIASGKGGVGKTWLAVSLSHALARRGRRVLLFDGDLGLANVDVQLGLGPGPDLAGALVGRGALAQAVRAVEACGFDVLPGRSGSGQLARIDGAVLDRMLAELAVLARRYDLGEPLRSRMAVELRPPVPVDKGTVTAELVRDAAVAVFAGDDAGDLLAFDVLTRLAESGEVGHAVRIGVRSAEAPPGIFDADVLVDGPQGLADVLAALAAAVSARA